MNEDETVDEGGDDVATHCVIATDIAVTAVTAADGLHLFARSLASSEIDIRDDYGRLIDSSAAVGPIREGGDTTLGGPSLPVTSTRNVALFAGPVTLGPDGTTRVELE